MKLLLDQDVYALTAKFLEGLGHDVVTVSDLNMATASDEENLQKAAELDRILITRDRDYGNLVFVRQMQIGVLYLRMLPSNRDLVHNELKRVLDAYTAEELRSAFVVVEVGRHRFRKL
jgi:predicted nuclease of predicted toxin-antitoxin system